MDDFIFIFGWSYYCLCFRHIRLHICIIIYSAKIGGSDDDERFSIEGLRTMSGWQINEYGVKAPNPQDVTDYIVVHNNRHMYKNTSQNLIGSLAWTGRRKQDVQTCQSRIK